MKQNNLIVVKSNKLIEASYRLNLDEQRLILACIAQLNSRDTVYSKKDEFIVSAKTFASLYNLDLKNSYRQIKNASESLFERKITIQHSVKNRKLITRWVSDVEYDEDNGQVTLGFATKILPYLSQIESEYKKYNLEDVSKLNSVHSIRIYEICLQYVTIGSRILEVDELKKQLGLDKQYPLFKDFQKWVLKPSLDQINKHTDIKIKMIPQRKLRKIVSLKFDIEYKKTRSVKLSNQKTNLELKKISSTLEVKPTQRNPKQQSIPSFILNN